MDIKFDTYTGHHDTEVYHHDSHPCDHGPAAHHLPCLPDSLKLNQLWLI